jgi:hypothetical protein
MQVLQNSAQTKARGLLRVLFLRVGKMPANPATVSLLRRIEKNTKQNNTNLLMLYRLSILGVMYPKNDDP